MTAADNESHGGKYVTTRRHAAGINVRFNMIDREERDIQDQCQRLGGSQPDKQRAHQARMGSNGNRIKYPGFEKMQIL